MQDCVCPNTVLCYSVQVCACPKHSAVLQCSYSVQVCVCPKHSAVWCYSVVTVCKSLSAPNTVLSGVTVCKSLPPTQCCLVLQCSYSVQVSVCPNTVLCYSVVTMCKSVPAPSTVLCYSVVTVCKSLSAPNTVLCYSVVTVCKSVTASNTVLFGVTV